MKRSKNYVIIILFLAAVYILASCAKSDSLHSIPSNLMLSGMTVTTNWYGGNTLVENYSFQYNSNNQLSQVIYTTNDTSIYDMISTFTYYTGYTDKITSYKYTRDAYKETDTFYVNVNNQINKVITPAGDSFYTYTYSSSGNNTSKLIATEFNQTNPNKITYNSYLGDILYSHLDSSGVNYTFDYLYYSNTNRIGDYLQLNSFAVYGFNFYQNAHMFKSMSGIYGTTTATYVIDADNVVTQTNVTAVNSAGYPLYTQQYDLSYLNY